MSLDRASRLSVAGEPGHAHRLLEEARPEDRVSIVAELIAANAEGRLDLASEHGRAAILNEADLRLVLAERPDGTRLSFRRAILRGASLRQVNLEGVDLSESDLSGAHFARANLRRATLESANLEGSDLANVDLRDAKLAEANLKGAMFEEANLAGATLRFADARRGFFEGANFEKADLLSADLREAELAGSNLRGAVLEEANLEGANLAGANLEGAVLVNANLRRARLDGANLVGASVRGAIFHAASMRQARLGGLDLSSCDLVGVRLARAWLARTQMEREQLGGALGEELASEFGDAKRGYLALERNFLELGDTEAERWAYRRRRRMQKYESLAAARASLAQGNYRSGATHLASFSSDQVVEWLCDYGESISRVFGSLLVVYVGFAILYGVTGSVLHVPRDGGVAVVTRRPFDLAIFSLLALTTSGTPEVGLQPRDEYVYFLTGLQAMLGISFTGLLGFVIGNRIRR